MSMLSSSGTDHVRPARVLDDEVPEFDVLYRHWFRFTWSVLRRLGVPEASIEDAAQEVWVIVHRRLDALESPHATRSWLFQIARRVAARHRRGEQRSRRKINALGWVPPRSNQPHRDRDSLLTVETLLGQIDERKREAFVLSELEGWSAPEIAKAAGTNPNTVYSRIRLARAELRAGWDAHGPDQDLEDALDDLRDHTRPPKGAAKRCWAVLMPKLALASKGTVAGVGAGAGAVASWKLAVAGAAVLGLAAIGGSYTGGRRPASEHRPATVTERDGSSTAARGAAPARGAAAPMEPSPATGEPEAAEPSASTSIPSSVATAARAAGDARPSRVDPPVAHAPSLSDETALLTAAQSSLAAGQAERALEQIADHRERFAGSALGDLRTLLEIKALCATGRATEAHAVLERAERSLPGSALLPKMRKARQGCAP
ncbi:RNA polymerase sigma factor [Paraliomyxa miuraensis]|uniref:RNA polymerase sigma factor n=1 Tax=Paraliomyxa miuraensis TaxID=376150 RepID=UPI00224E3B5A|nr:sigma-70 family RNA polymerase sigma factor [Paraliomyxa miuraensis]MCX4242692.1 sigma-70 family RNA polymerase sigma factor [Paraliomyxa miuraensis]